MECPYCKEEVIDGSIKCKYCKSMLSSHTQRIRQETNGHRNDICNSVEKSSLKHLLFSHRGRINRMRYWFGSLLIGLLNVVAVAILESISPESGIVVPLLTLYPNLMLLIKRAHDLGKSGHFCWLLLIPFGGIVPGIMLAFFKGTTGPNRFGPDPLAPSSAVSPETMPVPAVAPFQAQGFDQQLRRLALLKEEGIISSVEFDQKKQMLLGL